MKNYIIVNGNNVYLVKSDSKENARHKAINICDHSKFIFVNEIKEERIKDID